MKYNQGHVTNSKMLFVTILVYTNGSVTRRFRVKYVYKCIYDLVIKVNFVKLRFMHHLKDE